MPETKKADAKKAAKKNSDKVSKTKIENRSAAKSTAASIVLELGMNKYDINEVQKAVHKDVEKNFKGKVKSVEIYVKPEDDTAYYAVNGKGGYKISLAPFRK